MELIHLPYSPWSEKAAWALDVRGVRYQKRRYQPILGEPELRWRLGRWRGRVTVPVLRLDDRAIGDSIEIAKYADGLGSGPNLFPEGELLRIEAYNELCDRALDAGRPLALRRMLGDPKALREMVPPAMRGLGSVGLGIARTGILRTIRKYDGDKASARAHEQTLTDALDRLREDLAHAPSGDPKALLGQLTFADIAMAQVLVFVSPPAGLKIGEASRGAFHDAKLSERYADVIAWRDALYARYRAPKAS